MSLGEFATGKEHWIIHGRGEGRPGQHEIHWESLNTPLFSKPLEGGADDFVVVYPETVDGNPLKAKNIVRWLLHQPGWHTGKVNYGSGELYFNYGHMVFDPKGSTIAERALRIVDYPLRYYNQDGIASERDGTAYVVRKKSVEPDPDEIKDYVCIDGLSHKETSEILKRVRTFISYDPYTAYSRFAVLCGCTSIVMPVDGIAEEKWEPDERRRAGLAYGYSNVEKALQTAWMVPLIVQEETDRSVQSVKDFVEELDKFFG